MKNLKTTTDLTKVTFPKNIAQHIDDFIVAHKAVTAATNYRWNKSTVTVKQEGRPNVTITAKEFAAILLLRHGFQGKEIASALGKSRGDDSRVRINPLTEARVKEYRKAVLG